MQSRGARRITVVRKYLARIVRLVKGAYVINHVVSLCISGRVTRLCSPFACIPSQIHNRRRRKTRFYDRSFFRFFERETQIVYVWERSRTCVGACVCTGSWKLLPKYSHKRYSQHGGIPNLGGKCRSDGTLAVSNYIRRSGFWEVTRFCIPKYILRCKIEEEKQREKLSSNFRKIFLPNEY